MTRVTINSEKVAAKYRRRAFELGRAVRRWMGRAARTTNQVAVDYLRGGTVPGDYPVPVRSGNLLGSQDYGVTSQYAVLFNMAEYAVVIHEGQGTSSRYGRRPWLDDAVEEVQPTRMVVEGVSREVMAV